MWPPKRVKTGGREVDVVGETREGMNIQGFRPIIARTYFLEISHSELFCLSFCIYLE